MYIIIIIIIIKAFCAYRRVVAVEITSTICIVVILFVAFFSVRDEDDGRYFCRAINKAKSAVDGEQSADIIVHSMCSDTLY